MIDDLLVEALVKIGNHKKVKELCEPHVSRPLELDKWMVVRVLKALELFEEEYERLPEETKHLIERQPPQRIASGMCPECGETLWFQEGCATCSACGFNKCG